MFWIYILKSLKSQKYYIGQTKDIRDRLVYHNKGKNRSTKSDRPWQLVYKERFSSRAEAIKRERYLKSLKKRIYLEKLIKNFRHRGVEQ